MSVVQGLRKIGKLNVQTKAYDFASFTDHICSNENVFLKRYRWCVTMRIIEAVDEIAINIDLANDVDMRTKNPEILKERIAERVKYQKMALRFSIRAETLMEKAYRDNNQEGRHFDEDKFNNWIANLLELRVLIRSWRDSTLKGNY